MTRFLHTADLHLNGQRRDFSAVYLKRASWVLDEIERVAVDHACECIVVAGDVFDRPDLTIAERQLFSDWLGRLQTPVLAISGNHDERHEKSDTGDTCLSYLASLKLHLHLIHDGDPKIVRAFGVTWLLFPYHGWTNQEFRLLVAVMVQRVRRRDTTTPIVVVAHEAVVGCADEHGFVITKSEQIRITEDLGVTYWALGDIHAQQQILPNAYYSGAPHQTNFGETPPKKGVLIVDTDRPTEPELVSLVSPFPLVPYVELPSADEEWSEFAAFTGVLQVGERLPNHVVYRPPAQAPVQFSQQQARVPLFYQLEQKLMEYRKLPEQLIPKALSMADVFAEELQIETK